MRGSTRLIIQVHFQQVRMHLVKLGFGQIGCGETVGSAGTDCQLVLEAVPQHAVSTGTAQDLLVERVKAAKRPS